MIRCDEYNRVCVLSVDGDLSGDEAPDLRQAIEERLTAPAEAAPAELVIDLEKCPFIGSIGLEVLLFARRRCADSGRRLSLANLDGNCRKVLEITRLTRHFDIQSNLAAALKDCA